MAAVRTPADHGAQAFFAPFGLNPLGLPSAASSGPPVAAAPAAAGSAGGR